MYLPWSTRHPKGETNKRSWYICILNCRQPRRRGRTRASILTWMHSSLDSQIRGFFQIVPARETTNHDGERSEE